MESYVNNIAITPLIISPELLETRDRDQSTYTNTTVLYYEYKKNQCSKCQYRSKVAVNGSNLSMV